VRLGFTRRTVSRTRRTSHSTAFIYPRGRYHRLFWSAVAERGGDTAFGGAAGNPVTSDLVGFSTITRDGPTPEPRRPGGVTSLHRCVVATLLTLATLSQPSRLAERGLCQRTRARPLPDARNLPAFPLFPLLPAENRQSSKG